MFSKILVFLEQERSLDLVTHLVSLAGNTGASVTLLSCTQQEHGLIDPVEWHLNRLEAEIQLEKVVEALQNEDIPATGILLDCSDSSAIPQLVAQQVFEHDADLLVLESAARHLLLNPDLSVTGATIYLLGSDPVLSSPESDRTPKYMIPLDCSLRAECVLPVARYLSQIMHANMLLAHVVGYVDIPPRLEHNPHIADLVQQVVEYNLAEGRRYLDEVQESLAGETKNRVEVDHNVRQALHQIAREESVDMVILSAHGLSGNHQWPYGSVTSSFITQSDLPLMIVQDNSVTAVDKQRWADKSAVATRSNHVT